MSATILGLGTASPKYSIDIQLAAQYASSVSCDDPSQYRKLEALYRRSGVKRRGSVLLESHCDGHVEQSFYPPLTSPSDRGPTTLVRCERFAHEAPLLGIKSARNALASVVISASEITHLVTVTCTGFSAPGIDIALIQSLGLSPMVERVQVGFMGCHGSINGMRVARGLVAAEPSAVVLMTSVELCSLHYQYGFDADRIVSGALFADGSGSLVIANRPAGRVSSSGNGTHKTNDYGTIVATGSYLIPDSCDAMTWRIGDHGFEMTLAATVPGLIEGSLKNFLVQWLAGYDESIDSIGGWLVHPGGARILSSVDTAMGFDSRVLSVSRDVLAEHGNMSSATMLFIMERFAKLGRPKPWLMLGFGPGLEIEVALIR